MKPDKTILADKLIEMLLQTALLILYQHKEKTHTKKNLNILTKLIITCHKATSLILI